MIDRLEPRLTYANVTATLALFVALGGSSYAALKLPRDRVGSAQIRRGAVSTSELRDRSVRLRDMNVSARAALRGQRGPGGAAGPQGAPGPPATKFFASVSPSGSFLRGNASSGGHAG